MNFEKTNTTCLRLLLFVFVLAFIGCATRQEGISASPTMSEANAREIARAFANAQGWKIKGMWNESVYVPTKGEWESLFDVDGSGCPYAVYVNDKTGATRAETIGLP